MQDSLIVGDTLDFLTTIPDYPPADGWTLQHVLVPRFATPTQAPIQITGATSGSDYRTQASPATTAAWKTGSYSWWAYVEKTGARQQVDSGEVVLLPDPTQAAQGYDGRSHARKALEAIEAVLERRATLDQEEYTINGRSLKRTPVADLMRMRSRYAAEVRSADAAERLANGLAGSPKLQVRL